MQIELVKVHIRTLIIGVFIISSCISSYAGNLESGRKYKIKRPIYIVGNYDDNSNKTISRQTAHAFLGAAKVATKSYTAFQSEVPTGTIVTIVTKTTRPWYHFFAADTYQVSLYPDVSQGLEVELQLNRGFEGNLDGLNSDIFSPEK